MHVLFLSVHWHTDYYFTLFRATHYTKHIAFFVYFSFFRWRQSVTLKTRDKTCPITERPGFFMCNRGPNIAQRTEKSCPYEFDWIITWKNFTEVNFSYNLKFSRAVLSAANFAILFSLKILQQKNGNFYKMQFFWSNSCFLVTQETRYLHIKFTDFLPWISWIIRIASSQCFALFLIHFWIVCVLFLFKFDFTCERSSHRRLSVKKCS